MVTIYFVKKRNTLTHFFDQRGAAVNARMTLASSFGVNSELSAFLATFIDMSDL